MDVFLTGFSKKPCVAVFIIITVIMCITMSEAAPHKYNGIRLRHRKHSENELKTAKEWRHEHRYSLANRRQTNRQIQVAKNKFIEARHKVANALSYLLDKFNKSKNYYLDTLPNNKFGSYPVDWVPRVNFVDIHNNRTRQKMGAKKSFKYLSQKLYKPLKQYKFLFEQLRLVVVHSNSNTQDQIAHRISFINETVNEIQSLTTLLDDSMYGVKMTLKKEFEPKKLTKFCLEPDDTFNPVQDYIAFKAYFNFLKHWQREFVCRRNSKLKRCINYEKELYKRKENKHKKNNMVKREVHPSKTFCYSWTK